MPPPQILPLYNFHYFHFYVIPENIIYSRVYNSFTYSIIIYNVGIYKTIITDKTVCNDIVFKRTRFVISLRKGKELLHLLMDERSQVRMANLLAQGPLVPGLR